MRLQFDLFFRRNQTKTLLGIETDNEYSYTASLR